MAGLPDENEKIRYWRTMIFMVITLSQMGNVLAIRSLRDSLFHIGLFSNWFMVGAVALTFVLQFALDLHSPTARPVPYDGSGLAGFW